MTRDLVLGSPGGLVDVCSLDRTAFVVGVGGVGSGPPDRVVEDEDSRCAGAVSVRQRLRSVAVPILMSV